MKIEKGTQIKLNVENITVTVTAVYENGTVRYEGPNGERGILLTSKLEASQIVTDYKLEKTGQKVKVDHNASGKGAERHLYKDNFGYCIRQHGGFNEVKKDDQGNWYTALSTPQAYKARNGDE